MKKFNFCIAVFTIVAIVVGFSMTVDAAEQVNINLASQEELMQLEGVGSAYAQKIIEYREANGPFQQPEDIMKVKGIGSSTYEKNKDRITIAMVEETEPDSN